MGGRLEREERKEVGRRRRRGKREEQAESGRQVTKIIYFASSD